MPAIRNRFNAKKMTENGEQDSSNALMLKKKLIQLQEEEEEVEDHHQELNSNNNDNDDTRPASEEDIYDDLQTTRVHAKLRLKQDTTSNNNSQEGPEIFSQRSQSAQDQFAIALLRLQLDLDETSARLGQLETKLDHVSKQYQRQQQQQQQASKAGAKGGPFGSSNLANLIYLAWPVVVFVAVRAIERRAGSISPVKIVA